MISIISMYHDAVEKAEKYKRVAKKLAKIKNYKGAYAYLQKHLKAVEEAEKLKKKVPDWQWKAWRNPKKTARTGKSLKKQRIAAGLTQEMLGKKLKVSTSTIGRWERGETLIPQDYQNKIMRIKRRVSTWASTSG